MKSIWVGKRIQFLREHLQVSRAGLAIYLNVSEFTIQALEEGHQELSADLLKALVNKLNISADWLLSDRGEMFLSCANQSDPIKKEVSIIQAPFSEEYILDEQIRTLEKRLERETHLPLKQIRALFSKILNQPVEQANDLELPESFPPIKLQDLSFSEKASYYKELKTQMKKGQQEFFHHFHQLVNLVAKPNS